MVDLNIELPEGFLEEEIRCGYKVDKKMKEVWAVELDLSKKLIDVCKQNGINIMTYGGTTLGAVRHKGFIPWDDDIDFIVSREDYCKLCNIASKVFEKPYFFQTEYTDHGTIRRHAQLRNSDTTAIMTGEENLGFNQGIFVDIFPFDNIPDDETEFKRMKVQAKVYRKIYGIIAKFSTRYNQVEDEKCIKGCIKHTIHLLVNLLNKNNKIGEYFYKKYETRIASYDNTTTKKCGLISFLPDEKRFYFSTKSTKETIMMPFEFLKFPVPVGYEEHLINEYGDYHKYVVGGSLHGNVLFDACRPYTQYLKRK